MADSADANPEFKPVDHPLITHLKTHLDDWNIVEAEREIEHVDYQEWIIEHGLWELTPIILEYLDKEHVEKCPHVVATCGRLLEKLATKCKPKEVIIALIEHCEAFQSDVKFKHILPTLCIVYRRLHSDPKGKLALTLDWTFDTLVSHISAISIPDIPSLDDSNEWCTLEMMEETKNLLTVVDAFVDCIEQTTSIIFGNQKRTSQASPDQVKCNQLLMWSSLEILAIPLVSLNLNCNIVKSKQRTCANSIVKPLARELVERLINIICKGSSNLLDLIEFDIIKQTFKKDRFSSIKEEEKDRWKSAIGTLFYIIFDDSAQTDEKCKQGFVNYLPFVYLPNHLFNLLLPSIIVLIREEQNYLSVHKGIRLGLLLTERIALGSMSKDELQMQVHSDFLKNLIRIVTFSTCEEIRKLAYHLFEKYYGLFEANTARHRLVNQLLDTVNQSGFLAQIIVKIKDTVLYQMNVRDNKDKEFLGHNLKIMIKRICVLKHGAETDILEVSDEVMASLNFLICVMIRDKSMKITGIWDLKDELISSYLKPLKTAIDLSRGHYQLKQKESRPSKDSANEVTLMVGGQTVPQMSSGQMADVINAALNTFDMMECVLSQLNGVLSA